MTFISRKRSINSPKGTRSSWAARCDSTAAAWVTSAWRRSHARPAAHGPRLRGLLLEAHVLQHQPGEVVERDKAQRDERAPFQRKGENGEGDLGDHGHQRRQQGPEDRGEDEREREEAAGPEQ